LVGAIKDLIAFPARVKRGSEGEVFDTPAAVAETLGMAVAAGV